VSRKLVAIQPDLYMIPSQFADEPHIAKSWTKSCLSKVGRSFSDR
jgi:hypothetical protein